MRRGQQQAAEGEGDDHDYDPEADGARVSSLESVPDRTLPSTHHLEISAG